MCSNVMPRHQLLRRPLSNLSSFSSYSPHLHPPQYQTRFRFQSTSSTSDRTTRILDRVPRRLRKYTDGLRNAPFSHVLSFLILHELTAVVPLVGLAGAFHYWGLPSLLLSANYTAYLAPGIERFGRYFRRKGWFGLSPSSPSVVEDGGAENSEMRTVLSVPAVSSAGGERIYEGVEEQGQANAQSWNLDTPGSRIVMEVAAAYAITKALLPLRLMLSVWATPWFARVVVGKIWKGALGLRTGAVAVETTTSTAPAAATTRTMGKMAKEVGKEVSKP